MAPSHPGSLRPSGHRRATACLLAGLALLALGCAPPPAIEPPAPALPLLAGGPVATVLVAGSDEQAVFDNARRAFADELRRTGTPFALTMLSAAPTTGDAGPATLAGIDAAFAQAPDAAACLFFATSHGIREGLALTLDHELLTPARLDAILDRHCAGKPTVAIISSCFSGSFADAPMPAGNRIILTASARDRTSFGCSNDLTYTYFDNALLDLFPNALAWDELYAELKNAIAAREKGLNAQASLPQASFGGAMAYDVLLGPS